MSEELPQDPKRQSGRLEPDELRLLEGSSVDETDERKIAQLRTRLKSDPALLETYVEQMIAHGLLDWRYSKVPPTGSDDTQLIGRFEVQGEFEVRQQSSPQYPVVSHPQGKLPAPISATTRKFGVPGVTAIVLGVAAICIAFGVYLGGNGKVEPPGPTNRPWSVRNINYGFDANLEGWKNVRTSSYPGKPFRFSAYDPPENAVTDPHQGIGMVAVEPFGAHGFGRIRNQPHETLVLRSPEFGLTAGSEISSWLIGGNKPASILNEAELPKLSSPEGGAFLALRRVSDGAYVLIGARSIPGQTKLEWEEISWKARDLERFAVKGERYTLDLVDYSDGAWGWIGLDDVALKNVLVPPAVKPDAP